MQKRYLVTPGPSPVPQEVLLEMGREIIHHRTPEFRGYIARATENLQKIFGAENDTFIFASSGTGAMEAAVSNVLSAGDRAIAIRGGKFGERWGELVEAFGGQVIPLDIEWGTAPDPQEVKRLLDENPDAKVVYATLCETSTATATDVEALGEVVKDTPALLAVDGISGVGAMEMRADDWNVDLLAVGSQKALMLPPGLAFLSVSEKAWKVIEKAERRAYYFDLLAARKKLKDNDTPYTGAVSLVRALAVATDMIVAEGVDNVVARHRTLAGAMRAAVKALGLELLSKSPADAVTAILLPDEVDGAALKDRLEEEYGVTVAGGQAQLKGKILRLAHMGYMAEFDVITAVSALEMALADAGYDVKLGAGVAAAEKALARG